MATTIEELVVTLQAENKAFIAAMQASQKATTEAMTEMASAVNKMAEEGNKDLTFFQTAMATMTGFIGGEAVKKAFQVATDAAKFLFQTFVVDGVASAAAEQEALNKLNQSLGLAGTFSRDAGLAFKTMASDMERATGISSDLVLEQSALARNFTNSNEQARELIRAAVDLSAATGKDLNTSVQQLGQSLQGNAGRLGQSIKGMKELTEEQLKAGGAIDLVSKRFKDAGEKSVQTYNGQLRITKEAFESLTQVIGNAVVENLAVVNVFKAVNQSLFGVTDAAEGLDVQLKVLVGRGISILLESMALVINDIDVTIRTFQTLYGVVSALLIPVAALAFPFVALASGIESATKQFTAFINDTGKNLTAFGQNGDGVLSKMTENLLIFRDAADKGTESARAGMVAAAEPINNNKKNIIELTESMKALKAEGQGLIDNYYAASVSGKASTDQQLADAELLRQQRMMDIQAQQEGNFLVTTSNAERREMEMAAENDYFAVKMQVLQQQQAAEMAAVDAARTYDKEGKEKYEAAKLAIQNKYINEGKKASLEHDKFNKDLKEQEVKDMRSQIDKLATLKDSGNAYAKAVGKAAAITQTTINTAEGSIAAYKALAPIPIIGPALGAAAAAAVIADGTSKLAQIRGAQKGIDEVPGIGNADTFGPVALAPGERVVPGETNQDLKKAIAMILSGQAGGGGNVQVTVHVAPADGFAEWLEIRQVERVRTGTSLVGA